MYRSSYVVDYETLIGLSLLRVPQTIHMADSASSIDNAPNSLSATKSRTLNLISRKRPQRYQIAIAAPGPTTSDGPQTRDRVYHKTITGSTIRYVNAQLYQREMIR
jgi:hypothetical protein